MFPKTISTLAIAITLLSCDGRKVIFSDSQSFGENYEWKKDDKKVFVINIRENRKPVQLVLTFRYATGYPYDKALLRITEIAPDRSKVMRDVDVIIRDEKGEFIGEKGVCFFFNRVVFLFFIGRLI